MKEITPTAAFEWLCDNCGRNHFGRPVCVPRMEMRELMIEQGRIDPETATPEKLEEFERFLDIEFCVMPETVTCPDCKETYSVPPEAEPWGGLSVPHDE